VEPEAEVRVREVQRIRDAPDVEEPSVVRLAHVSEELRDPADRAALEREAVQDLAVVLEGRHDHQTILARSSVETRSTARSTTSITVSSIAASRYWKSWIELKSRKPIPPPPTNPVASESRTFTSKQ
jgi:hypothetical protein